MNIDKTPSDHVETFKQRLEKAFDFNGSVFRVKNKHDFAWDLREKDGRFLLYHSFSARAHLPEKWKKIRDFASAEDAYEYVVLNYNKHANNLYMRYATI